MVVNPENERVKRCYKTYLREAKGLADSTIDQKLYAIALYEAETKCAAFKSFRKERAMAFRGRLLERSGKRKGELSTRSTVDAILRHLKAFFAWLAVQPGYVRAVRAQDAEFFNLSRREAKLAAHRREKMGPPIDLVAKLIRAMPSTTAIEKRDQALIALLILTGVRVKALTTLKLKHVMPDGTGLVQDAREVDTKAGKTFNTYFFPIGDDIISLLLAYVGYLRRELGFTDNDPLFPSTRQAPGEERQLSVQGLSRSHWGTADPVRAIVKRTFEAAGEYYFNPHTFRNSLVALGQELCHTPEEFKAWSQNLGHDDIMTGQRHYGTIQPGKQRALIKAVAERPAVGEVSEEALRQLLALVQKR